ncbi:kinase-like protein [Coniochaeta ligniaria NRRL 30616]|uniref:non-specific serine/threonine protein kinase n=1 Tax=Coniochaeta ligniaria NRRL 30616 TaxID=1408157 RepID=A0A1J7JD52_9PEZI|nr:kinase-like protein [Coniochaeta ligniaria NRRL 30616]
MDSDSGYSSWKYFAFDLGECEDIENYEPGGFHPVHLGDVYDSHYRVVHKLGFGGFSTVWLARQTVTNRWVALKIVAARELPTYHDRSVIASHPSMAGSHLFAMVDEQFWIDGPNGRHLCLVFPGIYSRLKPAFARDVYLQAVRALAQLHANGLCHGDFTTSNMALRLSSEFDSYEEADLFDLFGRPQTAPLQTYSGQPPGPHGPEYIVLPLDFCSSTTTNLLSREICIIDFDQSFTATSPPPKRPGIPAKCLAPEVVVGRPASPASDVWALGCAVFRMRSGEDLFLDYDTDCPEDALRQIVKGLGELPEEWRRTRFDEEGIAVGDGEDGELFWSLEETRPLADRVRGIVDEPPGLFINRLGEEVDAVDEEPEGAMFEDDAALGEPYPAAFRSMVWKPTAVCVAGSYFTAYSDETDGILEAFPRISEPEAALLGDLLSKIFVYDPTTRFEADELIRHPWFSARLE